MKPGVLVGYFASISDAKRLIWILEKRGFFKIALLHRNADNQLYTHDPIRRWLSIILVITLFFLSGLLTLSLGLIPVTWSARLPLSLYVLASVSALIGLLSGSIVLFKLTRNRVDRDLLEFYAGSLLAEETILLLQARVTELHLPMSLILSRAETTPVIFIRHSPFERRGKSRTERSHREGDQSTEMALRRQGAVKPDKNIRASYEMLKKIRQDRKWIHDICADLSAASRIGKGSTGIAEWIIDNEYLINRGIHDILLNLPRSFFRSLPVIRDYPHRGCQPYVYSLARDIIGGSDLRLSQEQIISMVNKDKEIRHLTIAELWSLPQMLRIVLIEKIKGMAFRAQADLCESQEASFWANRLIAANRHDVNLLFSILAELSESKTRPSPYFGSQLIDHLYDETDVLVPVQSWLERNFGNPLNELVVQEQNRQARELLSVSNAFTSLRQLMQLDWNELFEDLNCVTQVLEEDPSGTYSEMDFATRDTYRRAVEEFASLSGIDEQEVARRAVEASRAGTDNPENPSSRNQIGYYLVGRGRKHFAGLLGCRESLKCRVDFWIRSHHCAIYLSSLFFVTCLFIGIFSRAACSQPVSWPEALIILLAILPASQVAVNIVNHFLLRLLPTKPLPKMDFRKTGIKDEFKTLVVIPTLLIDRESIRKDVERLEIRYIGNKDKNILFSLFSDFTDSSQKVEQLDQELIGLIEKEIRKLNSRYGDSFLLFHRERSWSESEQKFIGWERKRGKLEQLNGLLHGTLAGGNESLIRVGSREQISGVRFVITLDTDTQLPHGSARRMVETLAHPLNQPRFDSKGNLVPGTYTIIQPRITSSLPSTNMSLFSRHFSDSYGLDPYCKIVSDVYQDLSGEGSYHGKGIYDVKAFHQLLSRRFPEDLILSHDLLEGAHARVGLANDIELYDEFPPDYLSYARRLHRWIRGDWQIAAWLLPWVPMHDGKLGRNPLSLFSRWKVFDNLRRSLVPVSSLLLLILSWTALPDAAIPALTIVALYLLWPVISRILRLLTSTSGYKEFSLSTCRRNTVRALAEAAMLPHIAFITTGAILRVLYRLFISHRHLLDWRSSQAARFESRIQRYLLVLYLLSVSLMACGISTLVYILAPENLAITVPITCLWFFSPLAAWILTSFTRFDKSIERIPPSDRLYLRGVMRRTWRYFDDFVTPGTHWLPPDNYQVSHQDQIAMRTSPTNVGFWMLSLLGARDCGYVCIEDVIERLAGTMKTIDRLEKHEGHLLNWYDLKDLSPLEPRYISSVDSGNLIASVWVLVNGLGEMLEKPVVGTNTFSGFVDTGSVLQELVRQESVSGKAVKELDRRMDIWRRPASRPLEQIAQLLDDAASMPEVLESINKASSSVSDIGYWCTSLAGQITGAEKTIRSFLGWTVPLLGDTGDIASGVNDSPGGKPLYNLPRLPSLTESTGDLKQSCLSGLSDLTLPPDKNKEIQKACSASRKASAKLSTQITGLISKLENFSASINMKFLYSSERKLFAVGFNLSSGRLDNAFYDLLASEARLCSFISIARGEVPLEHWFSLGRPHTQIGSHRVLMSWSGTMFEYLMPLILQHPFDNSLLKRAMTRAVDTQIRYGSRKKLPWGMSESAYGNLDLDKNYQYMAFGIPALSLNRMIQGQNVVAPYATMLSLGLRPAEAVKNLRRLQDLGLYNEYGFYEAVDFSRKARKGGDTGIIIQTYMAHHQGMSMLSLINLLKGNIFRHRFHSNIRVKACEMLLHEKIPTLPQLQLASPSRDTVSETVTGGQEDIGKRFPTPHTGIPKTRLLSNGNYNLMLTNAGGGYSHWNGLELTRWRSDRTTDEWGGFIYIYEKEEDRLWSAAYLPANREPRDYEVEFSLDRVTYSRTDFEIQSVTDAVVSPEDDVEIRRISLTNRSDRRRTLLITSYFELSMADHSADRQHPAFSKLFIQTEAVPDLRALLAHRRSRTADPPECYLAHCLTGVPSDSAFNFETDRQHFIGRGNTLSRPEGAISITGNNQGSVLDPVFSLTHEFNLAPGQRREYAFILAVASKREKALSLVRNYSGFYYIDRAMDFAWRKAQIELRLLHIQPEEARRFQQLANHMLYPNPLLRAPDEQIAGNHKGQAGLWPYGISGDLPIIVVSIAESRDINLIRQLLKAHTYWKMHGFIADLVILNEEESGYQQMLRDKLVSLIQAYSPAIKGEMQGNVILRSADQLPDEDLRLLKAAAGVILVAARGGLAQQLGVSRETADSSEPLETGKQSVDPPQPLQDLPLIFYNGFGGFTLDGREYVINLDKKTRTPLPWINVIANPDFGTILSESGGGFTWYGNSQRNRLTQWTNDPVLDRPSEVVYLRDEETGKFWTIAPRPVPPSGDCRIRHAAGYTLFEQSTQGLVQEMKVFVPCDEEGGLPVKLTEISLRNNTDRWREISVTFYADLCLGEHRENSQMHTVTHWDSSSSSLLGYNRYHPEYGERVTFAAIDPKPESYSGNRTSFIGRNRSLSNPAALGWTRLDNTAGARLDPCAALQAKLSLASGEEATVVCMLGQEESKEKAFQLIKNFREKGAVREAFDNTVEWWDSLLGAVNIKTPDAAADILVNRWLLYQTLSCRIWGRSAFYQSGGAFGFRDQLQDVMALLPCRPELARKHILLAASRQFQEGDVQHWWHPPSGAGIRSRISDDLLWLPYVVAQYLRVTGDKAILDEDIPFLAGPELETGQHEAFIFPEPALDHASLFEHCLRAVEKGVTAGPDGLPLFGSGDWNDGMNLVGIEGKGESVWLGWFILDVLKDMSELATLAGKKNLAGKFSRMRAKILDSIEEKAWDGRWYLRGRFDDGSPLGSSKCLENQIDSLPQAWAWLSGSAEESRAVQAIESAWDRLVFPKERVIALFDPPFDKAKVSPGYIKGYPPGVRENGGQYTHGAIWMAMAMARKGDGRRAVELLKIISPVEHSPDSKRARRYGLEPYVVAADVYRLKGKEGRGGWSWYTGSAAWLYRAWTEEILGIRPRGDKLHIDPVVPPSWLHFRITFRHEAAEYQITVENPEGKSKGVVSIELDGKKLRKKSIPLKKEGIHVVKILMGQPD